MSDRKINFTVNLPIKIFHAAVASTDADVQNFKHFDKKTSFLNRFWQSVDAILQDVSVAETICLMVKC